MSALEPVLAGLGLRVRGGKPAGYPHFSNHHLLRLLLELIFINIPVVEAKGFGLEVKFSDVGQQWIKRGFGSCISFTFQMDLDLYPDVNPDTVAKKVA